MVVAYRGQEYSKLKKAAIKSGQLFKDPFFPASDRSLFYKEGQGSSVEWKRPKDICNDPSLFVDGVSSRDLVQGELGNCWFVAACGALAANKSNWSQVIPDHKEQDWTETAHAGIFHFRFWQFGEWVDVVVDDFLPTRNGKLIYVHSTNRNEFWSALLEKAYAKVYGCYEALDGGELAEALEDFTGGVSESVDLAEERYCENEQKIDTFFEMMKKSMDNCALMCAAIPAKSEAEMEQANEVGLVKGHAYSVTSVKKVPLAGTGIFHMFNREKLAMIRLRNPWGGLEWKGAFSDGSPEWERIAKGEREKIGLTFDDDGEFWMTLDDFCKYFLSLAICHVVNTSFFSLSKRWREVSIHSEWLNPGRAGGCINNKDSFLNNPQFMFDVTDEGGGEVLLQLVQKTMRRQGEERMTIGFSVLKVEQNREYRLHSMQTVAGSSVFRNSRSMLMRRMLARGRYVLVACTFEPGRTGAFLLRVYSGSNSGAKELTLDEPKPSSCCACLPMCRPPVCVTQIKVVKAAGLERKNKGSINAYCVISCEGKKVRTDSISSSNSPEWNSSAVFYRKQPVQKTITVDVYSNNLGFDEFLGRQVYIAAQDCKDQAVEMPLKTKDTNTPVPGRILVVITTDHILSGI